MGVIITINIGLSLGLMPQTSLSGESAHCVPPATPTVSGAHAPDFVERLGLMEHGQAEQALSLGLMPQTSLSGCISCAVVRGC